MKNYRCKVCGYHYDPDMGDMTGDIEAGTAFEDLPDTWTCPICGVGVTEFVEL